MEEKVDHAGCSICLNDFTNPKIIDCHHVFCETCLCDFINKTSSDIQFSCPLCRTVINIPEGGAQMFPVYSPEEEESEGNRKLKKIMAQFEVRRSDFQQKVDEVGQKILSMKESIMTSYNKIDTQVFAMCEDVKTIGEDRKIEMKHTCDDEERKMNIIVADMNELIIKPLEQGIKSISEVLSSASIDDIDGFLADMETNYEKIKSRDILATPCVLNNFYKGEINTNALTEQLGEIETLRQATFIFSFNQTDLTAIQGEWLQSHRYIFQDTLWNIHVCYIEPSCNPQNGLGYHYIHLRLSACITGRPGEPAIKSCSAQIKLIVIVINADRPDKKIEKTFDKVFKPVYDTVQWEKIPVGNWGNTKKFTVEATVSIYDIQFN